MTRVTVDPVVTGFNFLEGVLAACVMLVVSSLFLFSLAGLSTNFLLDAYRHEKRHRRWKLEATPERLSAMIISEP